MAYPMPTTVNFSTGLSDAFIYLNTVTFNWFSNMIVIAVYLIFASGFFFAKRDVFGALAVGGFATFVVSLLLYTASMISGTTFVIVIGVAIVSFATLFLGEGT
jgi:hypothetical protein